jgi:hypothetical protein
VAQRDWAVGDGSIEIISCVAVVKFGVLRIRGHVITLHTQCVFPEVNQVETHIHTHTHTHTDGGREGCVHSGLTTSQHTQQSRIVVCMVNHAVRCMTVAGGGVGTHYALHHQHSVVVQCNVCLLERDPCMQGTWWSSWTGRHKTKGELEGGTHVLHRNPIHDVA